MKNLKVVPVVKATHRDLSVYAITENGVVVSVPESARKVLVHKREEREYNRILDMLGIH